LFRWEEKDVSFTELRTECTTRL